MVDKQATSPTRSPIAAVPAAPALLDALGHSMADKRIDVLRRLAHNGSISQAARDCGISYKAAWQALDTLTNLAGVTLVERSVGGAGGGGATLTDAGHALLVAADAMDQARAEVLARLQHAGLDQPLLARLAVRTSMRNQWPCRIDAVQVEGARVTVRLCTTGTPAAMLQARVTRESAELMGLVPGLELLAMAKATAVQVLPWAGDMAEGARAPRKAPPQVRGLHDRSATALEVTHWHGTVTLVEGDAAEPSTAVTASDGATALAGGLATAAATDAATEVAVRLDGGVHVVGFAAAGMSLQVGDRVQVCVPASAVVLALVDAGSLNRA